MPDAADTDLPVPHVSARGGGGRTSRALRMNRSRLPRGARLRRACLIRAGRRLPALSILGTWQIVEAVPRHWSKPGEGAALAAAGKRMLNPEVTFAPGSVTSKFKPLDCKSRVIYDANSVQVDALFDGNLPEPNPAAAAGRLGFPKGDIPGVDVRCLKALHVSLP